MIWQDGSANQSPACNGLWKLQLNIPHQSLLEPNNEFR